VSTTTTTDRSGYDLTGADDAAAEQYDCAVDSLLRLGDDVVDAWDATVAETPDFAMGQIGRACLRLISSEGPDAADAQEILDAIGDGHELHDREQRHLAAARAYAAGDLAGASETFGLLSIEYPLDPLALFVAHQIDFFSGDATNLRDRVGRTVGAWSSDDPRYGYVLGMLAFGLEECGRYDVARERGFEALARDARDVWALHAVVHTYEMEGLVDDGLRVLDERRPDWSTGNILIVHNAWHEALYLLELGELDRVLASYDATIHASSEKVALELLDASGLLWRLHLDGIDTGGRWAGLADDWAEKETEPWYSFNDMHAAMAYVGSGRLDDARALVDRLAAYAATPDPHVTNVAMTAEVGLPVVAAILAFGEEKYSEVVSLLYPIRTVVHHFGGSHAQRDAVSRTLLEAAIRDGNLALARALVSERITVKPRSRYAQRQLDRVDTLGQALLA
jgi:hypothetical protein